MFRSRSRFTCRSAQHLRHMDGKHLERLLSSELDMHIVAAYAAKGMCDLELMSYHMEFAACIAAHAASKQNDTLFAKARRLIQDLRMDRTDVVRKEAVDDGR